MQCECYDTWPLGRRQQPLLADEVTSGAEARAWLDAERVVWHEVP